MFTLHVMSCTFSKFNYGVHCAGDKRGGWRVHKFGKYVDSYIMCLHKAECLCVCSIYVQYMHIYTDTDWGVGEGSGSTYST